MNTILKGVRLGRFCIGRGWVAVSRSRVNRNRVDHWSPVNDNRSWVGNDGTGNHRMSYDRADCHRVHRDRVDDTARGMVCHSSAGCGNGGDEHGSFGKHVDGLLLT